MYKYPESKGSPIKNGGAFTIQQNELLFITRTADTAHATDLLCH